MAEANPNNELLEARETRQLEMVNRLLKGLERQAVFLQRANLTVKSTITVLAALVPALIAMDVSKGILLATSLGLSVLVAAAQVWQFDGQWRQYRLLVDQLRRELFLFRAHEDEYSIADGELRSRIFSDRTNKVIESQFSRWFTVPPAERAK